MRRIIFIFLTFFVVLFGYSCLSTYKLHPVNVIKVEKATYQSWQTTAQEKGTNVEIILLHLNPKINIKYIVFRKHKIKPAIRKKNGKLILTGTLVHADSKLSHYNKIMDKPNCIMYEMDGKEYTYKLKSLKRKPMKYHR